MAQVWLDSPEVFCVHPGSYVLLGVQAVLNSWRSMFEQAEPVSLTYRVIKRSFHGDLALHLVEERISSAGNARRGLVLASNCFLKTDAGWRLLSHHGSAVAASQVSKRPVMH